MEFYSILSIKNILNEEKIWKFASILLMIGIFINSSRSITLDDNLELIPHLDKLLHFFAWMCLGIALRLGFHTYIKGDQTNQRRLILILFIAIAYGIFDEIHQYFVPTRVMDIMDILADTLGAIFGILSANIIRDKLP